VFLTTFSTCIPAAFCRSGYTRGRSRRFQSGRRCYFLSSTGRYAGHHPAHGGCARAADAAHTRRQGRIDLNCSLPAGAQTECLARMNGVRGQLDRGTGLALPRWFPQGPHYPGCPLPWASFFKAFFCNSFLLLDAGQILLALLEVCSWAFLFVESDHKQVEADSALPWSLPLQALSGLDQVVQPLKKRSIGPWR